MTRAAGPGRDTIAAVATPRGRAAVGLVRLSGPRAVEILHQVAPGLEGRDPAERVATLVRIVHPTDRSAVDRALVTCFRGPASYTGEDVVELSSHGGLVVPGLVLDACLAAGAREAEPGEFTRRAYLHGKLDLIQVEAVADLIEARSRALHRASLVQLERGLSERIARLREGLVELEAYLAHHLDFPEEDDAPVPIDRILTETDTVLAGIDVLLGTAPEGELLRGGALTVIAGRPNAGKSSLYNALIGEERALVTEVPGTTRDALEATVELGGFPFRLVDTAGLREADDRIERLGIEVARRALARADLVLLCVEGTDVVEGEAAFLGEVPGVPVVVVRTKVDLGEGHEGRAREKRAREERARVGDPDGPGELEALPGVAGSVSVSVVTGQGLAELRTLLPRLVYTGLVESAPDAPVVTRRRQSEALRLARSEIGAFRTALSEGVPAEVAAAHLRSAESALERILGVIAVDDVLDVLFASFCVGK